MTQPGITFRETMAGFFALGPTDPAQGDALGEDAGTQLTMQATIDIDDVRRFIEDPDHLGSLNGRITFGPLGTVTSTKGVFNLFRPTSDRTLKLMVYELAFTHEGKDYYLAGRKEVRDNPVIDLWHDTTTLLTQLHLGTDKTGPVVGAGVLTLSVKELLKLLSTARATNASTPTESAAAMGTFFSFFLGELWHTYGPRFAR